MVVSDFILNKYAPLDLPQPLNGMPQGYLKLLPTFTWEDDMSTQRYVETLCVFAENLNVKHLDVVLGLFVQPLHGEAQKWFKALSNA